MGEDYTTTTASMRAIASSAAKSAGKRLRTQIVKDDDGTEALAIQANDEDPTPQQLASFESITEAGGRCPTDEFELRTPRKPHRRMGRGRWPEDTKSRADEAVVPCRQAPGRGRWSARKWPSRA